jgi:peroxiredoxin Q/BCP
MPLETGKAAPKFTAVDDRGEKVRLADFKGRKLVIYFYPKAFTPGCTAESCDFRDNYHAFLKAGYEVAGVSPDPPGRLRAFREKHDLPFRLLSDENHSIATKYGAWGKKKNYGKEYEGVIRSTIVVDEAGKVEHAWHNVRAKGHVGRVEKELAG